MRREFFALFATLVLMLGMLACATGDGCPDCNDGVHCTQDTCDEASGQCLHVPNDSFCQAGEKCDALEGCQTVIECENDGQCDDSDPCTTDTCSAGLCKHITVCACSQDSDCDDSDPCTTDTCNAGECSYENTCECSQNSDCDDSDPCTTDTCNSGECSHQNTCACSQDSDCDDSNPCSDDSCDQGQCAYTNNAAACDDSDACTENDICAAGSCAGQAIDCNDDNPCTDDACQLGQCSHTNNSVACDDSDACTQDEVCSGGICAGNEICCDDQQDNDGDSLTDCFDGDCTDDPFCGGCQPVAEPEPVPMAPLPGQAQPGRAENTGINGFSDDYIYDSTNEIKVGTRQEWGGTIIFFGQNVNDWPGVNTTNTIDANDTGREVQVAFYDPDRAMQNCAWNASCRDNPTECLFSITFLGWNPVQGGNRCNRGSGIESVVNEDGVLTVTTNPLFWNPNWDRQDCSDSACDDPNLRERRSDVRVVQSLRFVDKNVVELTYNLTNLGDLDHASTAQEMPTVYTANGKNNTPDLWRLFNSEGTEIAIDTPGNDGFFYENFSSPGGWATLQNDDLDYGVGLYSENRLTAMQGWQKRSLPFNNFRPVFPFAIPPHGTVNARAYLIIGSQATVADRAEWLDKSLSPIGCLDEPTPEAVLSGVVTVRGWALDNKAVSSMQVLVDGVPAGALGVGGSRPDVCLVWPAYPACPNVGFSGSLDTSGLSECQHLLEIRATDSDGNQRIIARRRVSVSH